MKDSYVFYKDQLGEEYRRVFDQVELYVNTQSADENIREERLGELLDILCSAQEAGKPVHKVVGNNLERFCRSFCADFGGKARLFYVLDHLKGIALVLLIVSAADLVWLLSDGEWSVLRNIDWNIFAYLTAILCAGLVTTATNCILRHMMFRTRRVRLGLLNGILIGEAVLIFIGILAALHSNVGLSLRPPVLAVALASGLYLLLYYLLWGKRNRRERVRLSELAGGEIRLEVGPTMEKKFQQARQRVQRKGQTLTRKEFLNREERDCRRGLAQKWVYFLLPLGITGLSWLGLHLTGSFETAANATAYIAVTLAAEYLIMWGLWRLAKRGFAARLAWVQAERERPKGEPEAD